MVGSGAGTPGAVGNHKGLDCSPPEPAGSSVAKAEGFPEPDPPAEAETSQRGQAQLLDVILETSHHPLC